MKPLRLIPPGTDVRFIDKRILALFLSSFLVVASLGLYVTKGLNLGIDFLGGVMIEAQTKVMRFRKRHLDTSEALGRDVAELLERARHTPSARAASGRTSKS